MRDALYTCVGMVLGTLAALALLGLLALVALG